MDQTNAHTLESDSQPTSPLEKVLAELDGVRAQGAAHRALCPAHEDRTPSLSISEGEDGRVLLHCFAGCSTESVLAAIGLELQDLFPSNADSRGVPEAVYEYTDTQGKTLFEVVRYPNKQFAQRRPDPENPGKYLWNRDGVDPVLYRLPSIVSAVGTGGTIYVAEGEKDVQALETLGVTATCNPGGAGKWLAGYSEALCGATVVVVADRDDAGRQHALQVAEKLTGIARSVEIVEPLAGKDAADHVEAGHGLIDFSPPADTASEDLSALLDELVAYVRRFVVLSDVQAEAIALYAVHTHVFPAADTTPYLQITSPEKRSGKSRLLEVLCRVVRSPWKVISPTEAVLFRYIDDQCPTVFIDEYDTIFKQKDYEGLRAILNAGFEPGTLVPRLAPVGGSFQLKNFNVYCPKVLGGIGKLPDTVDDRSIRIELKRRTPGEHVEKGRRRIIKDAGEPIRARLERAATNALPMLANAEPAIPDELNDRAADMWEPLLAIADLAGKTWANRARQAALTLSAGEADEDDSRGITLLRDIKLVFDQTQLERLSTTDLIRSLAEDPESPWADWWDERDHQPAKGSPQQLARLLKPYSIKSRNIRIEQEQFKGFNRTDFTDAFNRYLPQAPPASVPPVPSENSDLVSDGDGTEGTTDTGSEEDLESVWN